MGIFLHLVDVKQKKITSNIWESFSIKTENVATL